MAFAADDSLPELKLGSQLNKNTNIFSVTDIFLTLFFLPRPDDLCQISLTGGHWLPCSGPLSTECTMEQQCTMGKHVRIKHLSIPQNDFKSAVKNAIQSMARQYYEYSVSLWPLGWRKEGGICILILHLEGPACPMCSDGLCSGIQWTPASSGPGRWEREETRRHRNRKPEGWKSLAWSPLIRDGTMMSGYETHFPLECIL